jgi:4-amino-4-deoxy-L-arabinose transferase-like glycosyltransferase
MRLPVHTISKAESIAALAMLLGIIVTLQILSGAYVSGFGGTADEPAHMVTALMVQNFIANLDFHHPWQFAQQYYFHYPKVAIGHWPPVLYGLLGIWFLIFGASRATAMMFVAISAAATATTIYLIGKRLIGRWAGGLGAVLFVTSPLVQESSALVMSEHLVTLVMLASTLCFARFARTGRIADGLAFGMVAALAILTHGNAWALGLMPVVTLALTHRWYLLRRLGLWLAAVPVLVACGPWYVLTLSMQKGTWEGDFPSFWVQALPNFAWFVYVGVGFPVFIFALIGIWGTIIRVKPHTEVITEWAALAGLATATFLLHCLVPVSIESRYMMPLVPSIVLFSTAGINEIAHQFSARLQIGVVRVSLALALIAAFCVTSFALPLQVRNGGYGSLVRDVATRVSNVPQVWLISSDWFGEGCLVAAVALREVRPDSYVLRGETILAGEDWHGRNKQDRFDTPEKLAGLLDDLPVTIIVIDDRVPPDEQLPYHDRLKKLVASEAETWKLIGTYPQTQGGTSFANSLHVYARRPIASLAVAGPTIRLDRLRALMIRDELR